MVLVSTGSGYLTLSLPSTTLAISAKKRKVFGVFSAHAGCFYKPANDITCNLQKEGKGLLLIPQFRIFVFWKYLAEREG